MVRGRGMQSRKIATLITGLAGAKWRELWLECWGDAKLAEWRLGSVLLLMVDIFLDTLEASAQNSAH